MSSLSKMSSNYDLGSVSLPMKPGKTLIATLHRKIIKTAKDGQLAVTSTIDRQHVNVNQSSSVHHSTSHNFTYVVDLPVNICSSQVGLESIIDPL